jgi:hypothetical protein
MASLTTKGLPQRLQIAALSSESILNSVPQEGHSKGITGICPHVFFLFYRKMLEE